MPPHACRTRPPRPLLRTFCPARLAAAVLAQTYERLLPDARRPLPPSAPPAATPRDASLPRRRATGYNA
jgi:hypothetical protein